MTATKQLTVVDTVRQMTPEIAMALPSHIPAERFTRNAITAINGNPDLLKDNVDRRSLLNAVMKAAQDGLILDGKEAALVTFNGQVSYMPMIAGVLKKIRNSGEVSHPVVQIVYAGDDFSIDFVTDGVPVVHKPNLKNRGELIGFYAVAKLKDGNWTTPEFMTKDQVDEVRNKFSKSANGAAWTKSYGEMGRKTVLRRAAKYWPTSSDIDIDQLLDEDERDSDVTNISLNTPASPVLATVEGQTRTSKFVQDAAKDVIEAQVIPSEPPPLP